MMRSELLALETSQDDAGEFIFYAGVNVFID